MLVIDKPAGVNSDDFEKRIPAVKPSAKSGGIPRETGLFYRVHRLDKDTSGVLLIAKNDKALDFFQKKFQDKEVVKKYIALVSGEVKKEQGVIETLIGRSQKDRKKQKVYLANEPEARRKGLRKAVTEYRVLARLCSSGYAGQRKYTLLEVMPKTGRKHQIRCHLAFIGHPIVGDKVYSFKNQPVPKGLERQFLHASYLRIKMPNGEVKEFRSELPDDLRKTLANLKL